MKLCSKMISIVLLVSMVTSMQYHITTPYASSIDKAITKNATRSKSITATRDADVPLISGSFLQGWLCRDWSQARWNDELAAMKELGMETLIIQSSYDWATTAASSSAYGQDWSKYTTTSRYSLYPTSISELSGAYNSADQLERALIAAKQNDMTIFIGLISDDRWWRFGWGVPTASSTGNIDLVRDSYFAQWCDYNGNLSSQMIEEIWDRYSDDYAEQIGGWYYNNEIWNFDSACAGTDSGVYAEILANNFNYYLDAIEKNCPDKPLMVSPYFNRSLSSGAQYSDFWKSIFEKANFKVDDIFAPQDCIGEHPDKIDTAEEWIGGLAEATSEEGLHFWVNNETFTPSYTSASVDRVISQIEATKEYAETHILFSWNHYYNPLYNSAYQSYNDELATYIETTKSETNKIEGGIQINGYQISTTAEGFRTIYSVESSIDGKNVVECGLVYALADYAAEYEIYVGSENDYVKSFAGTRGNGLHSYNYSSSETAESYVMTMRFAVKSAVEFQAKYTIKAYALLSDGTYVHTDATSYTVYDVASHLYDKRMMNNLESHNYLYTDILKVVNIEYKEKDYDWTDTIVGVKR